MIAIISLLVSILLPAMQKAREFAKSTVCLTNLRGLGTCIALYVNDYEVLPEPQAAWFGYSFFFHEQYYVHMLAPYAEPGYKDVLYFFSADNHPRIFQCLDDPLGDDRGFEFRYHGNSYKFTYNFAGQPLESPLLCNCEDHGLWAGWEYHIWGQDLSLSPLFADASGDAVYPMHLDIPNYLFADFHAESISGSMADVYNYNISH